MAWKYQPYIAADRQTLFFARTGLVVSAGAIYM
jgi:hypothetical protein